MADLITTLSEAQFFGRDASSDDPAQSADTAWVHLLPSGQINGRDGRVFVLSDANTVIRQSMTGVDLPIDYEHAIDTNTQAKAVPAAGWIKDLQAREDGIWGQVEWTDSARAMIFGKEYRYLSPVLMYDASTKAIHRIIGAALVHRPNLTLKALSSENISMTPNEDPLAPIRLALGLNAQADTAAIVEALGISVVPDPRKYVPLEAVKELFNETISTKTCLAEVEAETRVNAAMERGHISPGMRSWAVALCATDPASFDDFVNSSPAPFAHLFGPSKVAARHVQGAMSSALQTETTDEGKMAKMLGIDPRRLA